MYVAVTERQATPTQVFSYGIVYLHFYEIKIAVKVSVQTGECGYWLVLVKKKKIVVSKFLVLTNFFQTFSKTSFNVTKELFYKIAPCLAFKGHK